MSQHHNKWVTRDTSPLWQYVISICCMLRRCVCTRHHVQRRKAVITLSPRDITRLNLRSVSDLQSNTRASKYTTQYMIRFSWTMRQIVSCAVVFLSHSSAASAAKVRCIVAFQLRLWRTANRNICLKLSGQKMAKTVGVSKQVLLPFHELSSCRWATNPGLLVATIAAFVLQPVLMPFSRRGWTLQN